MMSSSDRFAEALGNLFLLKDCCQTAAAYTHDRKIDQIIEIHSSPSADRRLIFYNCDGSHAEACGNGTRCAALWLFEQTGKQDWLFETLGGNIAVSVKDQDHITVTFPSPRLITLEDVPDGEERVSQSILSRHCEERSEETIHVNKRPDCRAPAGLAMTRELLDDSLPLLITPHLVNMGNPHLILWIKESVDITKWGPRFEKSFPGGVNVSFPILQDRTTILLSVWERGAGATRACGTAACATHASAFMNGFCDERSIIKQPGGTLFVAWAGPGSPLTLTGPARLGDPL